MILLLDIGNTRLKSAWLTPAGLRTQMPVDHAGRVPTDLLDRWRDMPNPEAVWVCNVAAKGVVRDVESFAREHWRISIRQLRSCRRQAGVLNGYRDPETLGADRWAALLGAMSGGLASCCIIDCGTAMTMDALDGMGRHIGGQIAPGMRLMREALGQRTVGVGKQEALPASPHFGRSTAEAVGGGVLHTCVAAIRGFYQECAREFATAEPRLLLTGGDAPVLLEPLADLKPLHHPDLVLQGLAAAARDSGA